MEEVEVLEEVVAGEAAVETLEEAAVEDEEEVEIKEVEEVQEGQIGGHLEEVIAETGLINFITPVSISCNNLYI